MSRYFTYLLLIAILAGSVLSMAGGGGILSPTVQLSFASHNNISVDIESSVYERGDDVLITGSIQDLDPDEDDVAIRISKPNGGSDNKQATVGSSGNFDLLYKVASNAADGLYTVRITYNSESVYSFFIVDEESDPVRVVVDQGPYAAGDEVEITGEVNDAVNSVSEVEITILDSANDEVLSSKDVNLDSRDRFSYDFELDNNADHGRYVVVVSYNEDDIGHATFEVEDENGGSNSEPITITLSKSTYAPGARVLIDGEVEDYEAGEDANIEVRDPSNAKIVDEDINVESDGSFEFDFDLDGNAEEGEYRVIVSYNGDEVEVNFDVSKSTSGSSSSGSSGLTVKLDRSSYALGDKITITGKVPKLVKDAFINIDVFNPDGTFAGVFTTADPASDLSYTASITLKSSHKLASGYEVRANYGTYEGKQEFSIAGQSSSSGGNSSSSSGALTVRTDKEKYAIDSEVRITGSIPSSDLVEGQKVLIRVNKPDGNPYRIDIVDPSPNGSYSYNVVIGGSLATAGEYKVVVVYNNDEATTKFLLGGDANQKPSYNLKIDGKSFPIEYEISGGQIKSMFVKPSDNKLVVSIDAKQDGRLVLTLPRNVIDSVEDGSDKRYAVATADLDAGVGNDNMEVRESETNGNTRTIVIDYEAGTDLIEIVGTSVVPEFPISAVVLAIAIVGIILVTASATRRQQFNSFFKNH